MLRLGAGGKRKCISEPEETFEVPAVISETLTETEQLENELFGNIEQQFDKKSSLLQNGKLNAKFT